MPHLAAGTDSRRWRAWLLVAGAAAFLSYLMLGGGSAPAEATGGVVQISGGEIHTCALMADSTVTCWGDNGDGQLGDGTSNESITPVTVCDSGSGVGCSGGAPLSGVEAISAGRRHTCALMQDGGVRCWGQNFSGELGDGTTVTPRRNAVDVCSSGSGSGCGGGSPLQGVVEMSAGSSHTCALLESTFIQCWGGNASGQLGIGSSDMDQHPRPDTVCVPPVVTLRTQGIPLACTSVAGFTGVDAGSGTTCAITETGGVKCWGAGTSGRLGNNDDSSRSSPVDVCFVAIIIFSISGAPECVPISGVADVTVGGGHACALNDDGRVRCWGLNVWGQLGDGTEEDRFTPVFVCASGSGLGCGGEPYLEGIQAITAGGGHTCAIAQAGDARCWGESSRGAVGDGTMTNRSNPVAVSGFASGATSVTGGHTHSCGSTMEGAARCWGSNSFDQLGAPSFDDCSGTNNCSLTPVTVGFGPKATDTPAPIDDTPTPTNTPMNTPPGGPTTTSTPQGPTPTPGGQAGDLDCNGEVTAIDAALLLQFLAGLLEQLPCPENADVNQDGTVNSIDAALILQYSAGLINSLPP